jgi:dienelactone hydrolase
MRIKIYSICFVVSLLFTMKTFSQLTTSGAWGTLTERANTPIDSMIGGFLEITPPGYNPSDLSKKYPLIIFLEGISQFGNGDTTELRYMYGSGEGMLPDIVRKGQLPTNNHFTVDGKTIGFIIISPQIRMQVRNGRSDPEKMASPAEVNDILNYVLQNYNVDPTRVYLLGTSVGGGSTWNYAGASVNYADRLAAIIPFSGASAVKDNHSRVTNIAQSNLPVWTFVVKDDVQFDTLAVQYIDSINTHPEHTKEALITEFDRPTGDHNSWNDPLLGIASQTLPGQPQSDTLYQWMLHQTSRLALTQPSFATLTASVDKSVLNLANGSMTLGAHGISFDGATVTLSGTISPNTGQPFVWEKVTGTGGIITSPNSLTTNVTGLKPGFYIFQLRVTNNDGSISVANVSVTVKAPSDNEYTKVEGESFTGSGANVDVPPPGVDKTIIDEGNDYAANFFGPGGWVEYNIALPSAGAYALYYRYSSDWGNPSMNIFSNDNLVTTRTLISNNTWQSDSIHITLGTNARLKFQAEHWAINYFELAPLFVESPLPVKFVYFNSQCSGSAVNLQWKTAQEFNSKSFDVQRSVDGLNWNSLSSIAAAGQSSSERTYHYSDNSSSGSSFYRIVESDQDGKSVMSSVVRSNCQSGQDVLMVSPNPVSNSAVLSIHLQQAATVQWKIIDSKGAMVQQNQTVLPSGSSSIPLNLSNYSKGIYTISIYYNNEMKTIKLIKK